LQRTAAVRHATATAYVAEVCERKNDQCTLPNGLIETLDGTTITDGIFDPWSLAFDGSGNLYAGSQNGTSASGFVTEYASGSTSPSRTISLKFTPRGLAVDASNNLDVIGNAKAGCCGFQGFGAVYGPSGNKQLQKLTGVAGFPGRPAIDAQGNLYVPNFDTFPGNVVVYAPGAKKPTRAIQNGIGFPKVLAFDSTGNLYVLNNTFKFGSNVTVYAAGTGTLIRTISKGMKSAYTMALDSHDNVYVANDAAVGVTNQVFVYAAGTTSLLRSIVDGVKYPVGLAFDASGNLYVANAPKRGATVTVYAPGASDPSNTYTLKESPTAIAVPPGE
jgi:sugar lactone lactonase YvrE